MNLLLLLAALACAQTTSDQIQFTGQVGVGNPVPQARLDARVLSSDAFALRVSSANGDPLLVLTTSGRLGVKRSDPAAVCDVAGSGDDGSVGLQLRVGNSSSTMASSQLLFAMAGTDTYRHSIRSRHAQGQNDSNALDFFLWTSTGDPAAVGSTRVMSLEASVAASSASVHIHPFGSPTRELVVSNGALMGGGVIHRLKSLNPSLRALKRDVAALTEEASRLAYAQAKALKHVRFAYKGDPSRITRRGLLYEEAPETVRGPGDTLSVNERLAQIELALQELDRRVNSAEAAVTEAEKRGR